MKKSIAILSLLAVSSFGFGQDVNKLIKQADVEKVIKTLSADDMQGRATFTPGIGKAAQYIESQYKEAGLVPLTGNTTYRQNFTKQRVIPGKTMVSINGKIIPQDSVFASTTATSLNWSNNSDVQIVKLGSDKNFMSEYRSYMKSGKKMLVLVDVQFSAYFENIK